MEVELIIFDLDGTLVNSIPDLTDSLNHVAKLHNKSVIDESRVTSLVGSGINKLLEDIFNINQHHSSFASYFNQFMEHHEQNYSKRSHLYNNTISILKYFKAKKLAILSNKINHLTKQVAKDFNIYDYFDIILGATNDLKKKPSGEPITHILNKLNIIPSKAIMVGDSEHDIMCAKSAGIVSVALTSGYRSLEQLKKHKPNYIIDDIIELKSIIQ